jgi:two-component system, NtrC family, sensor kinase
MNDTVVIVDDSLTVRMDLAEAFEAAGFLPVPCATAAEARRALESSSLVAIVLDVILPDGDGIELLKEARASWGSRVAVLMLSTEAEVKDRIRALQTGADEYVGKPYEASYVVAKTQELLRARRHEATANNTTVLVIDDSQTFREELRQAFEFAGHTVLLAASGEEGLQIAANRRPSAIVVDGHLPGVDGATVIRRIRLDAALRGTPCLLLTASDDRGAELSALEAGADAFVRKEEDLSIISAKLAAALRAGPASSAETLSLLGPRKILAVDDSVTYLHEIAAELRGEGYDVILARSGEEALELLAVEPFDCVLLDVLMPGIGGQETCRRIKSAPSVRDIPLIMLTSLDNRSALLEGIAVGADDFVPKSSELDVLKARVRAQLRRKQFEDENRRIREQLLRKELEASEARAARQLAETRAALVEELEYKNRELEAFSYSVSHDLRAPLRSIEGFCRAILEDNGHLLDAQGKHYLQRACAATHRMSDLIDDLLQLSRVSRAELNRESVDLSALALEVLANLQRQEPARRVILEIEPGLGAYADDRLMRIALENLLGNAWKFTSKVANPKIEFFQRRSEDGPIYSVRDNGAGFNMSYADKLFRPFQRLHTESDFPGTGIGLATIQRIIARHGGRIFAEGSPGQGATFRFSLGKRVD